MPNSVTACEEDDRFSARGVEKTGSVGSVSDSLSLSVLRLGAVACFRARNGNVRLK